MPRDESSTPDPAAYERAAAWLKTLPPPLVMKDRGPEGCWTMAERIAQAAAREATARAWQTAPPDVLRTLEAEGIVSPWREPKDERPHTLRTRLIAVAAELLLRDDPELDAVAVALCAMADEVGAIEVERDGLRNCPPRWLEPAGRGSGAEAPGWRDVEELARRAMEPLRAEVTAEEERQHRALLRLYGEDEGQEDRRGPMAARDCPGCAESGTVGCALCCAAAEPMEPSDG